MLSFTSERWCRSTSRRGRRTWFVLRPEDLLMWDGEEREAFREMLERECELHLELPVAMTPRDLTVQVWLRDPIDAPLER